MVATSASTPAAAAAPLPTGAGARLSLPPSLAAVGGGREAAAVASVPHLSAAAAAQPPQQPQLIPVEPRLLARSVSYSFPAASSSMTIR